MSSNDSELERLRIEVQRLSKELTAAQNTIRRAKNIEPVQRPSFRRVLTLVSDACMSLERSRGGWLLRMGKLTRRFRFLKQIWEILIREDWYLSDIFSPAQPKGAVAPRLPFRAPILLPHKPPVTYGRLASTE